MMAVHARRGDCAGTAEARANSEVGRRGSSDKHQKQRHAVASRQL
jgi:hypothetical protein